MIVPWLKENYGCEVVCFCADVGQAEELDGLEEKALASGASQLIIHDMKEEFVEDYIFPTLKAGAIYERKYLLGTSMARPLIAKHMVDVAHEVGADAVSHGATGKGNDQVRFELTFRCFGPAFKSDCSLARMGYSLAGRCDSYAKEHNVPIATEKSIYSRDRNLWHLSHEGGLLEDPWKEPEESMYVLSTSPENAPEQPTYVDISFDTGTPVAMNGELYPGTIINEIKRSRRCAWHWSSGPGRKPIGWNEISRSI